MKRKFFAPLLVLLLVAACTQQPQNPFYTEWDTPFGIPPFAEIREEHYRPAMEKGIIEHQFPHKRVSDIQQHFQCFCCLQCPDSTGKYAEYSAFCACWHQSGRRR